MSAAAPIGNAAEAERAIAALHDAMDQLAEILAQETELLRKGHVRNAAALESRKQSLASAYSAAAARVKLAGPLIARTLPEALEPLRKRHADVQLLLQKNMTVLATAHAVSEGIIRGVSGELARKRTPSTYGATGRTIAPSPRAGQPIAVSKAL
jgi:flagellar biosynthesis/type III secretory pathway chaperone